MSEETLDKEDSIDEGSEGESSLSAPESTDASGEDLGAAKKTLGVERWVQLSFMVAALLLVWVFDHLITAIWYLFADPDETIATFGAVVAGIVAAIALYRHKPSYTLTHEVAEELSKVSWPTRKETSSSTIVVVVASIIAAAVLFMFDTVWAAVTDLVYKV
ncbi:MAG: preprotein translocase subunit SecE [Myxococcales bacterium]